MIKRLIAALVLFLAFSAPAAYAQTPEAEPTTVPEAAAKTEYVLPYPGMLPDNPLYVVKQVRDYVLERLITDPSKKTEFYILQGDKRLSMGIALTDRKKYAEAETVISKGEKYMEKAVITASDYKAKGNTVPGYLADKLSRSLTMHEETITGLKKKFPSDKATALQGPLDLVNSLLAKKDTFQ